MGTERADIDEERVVQETIFSAPYLFPPNAQDEEGGEPRPFLGFTQKITAASETPAVGVTQKPPLTLEFFWQVGRESVFGGIGAP